MNDRNPKSNMVRRAHSPLTTHHSRPIRPRAPSPEPRAPGRPAFTLVEMLVAMVLTLILVTAIAQFYAIIGDSVKDGRAMIELGSQMRAAVARLKSDLDLITVSVVPWTDEGSASGYFEYFEGIANDYNANGNFNAGLPVPDTTEGLTALGVTNMIGDGDDFVAFTMRSSGQPFTGRYTYPLNTGNPVIYTSQLAEVVWWVGFDDLNSNDVWDFAEPRQIYRRQLLIRPDLLGIDNNREYLLTPQGRMQVQTQLNRIWQENDISLSVRLEVGSTGLVYRIRPNSLNDLSKREHRFAHQPINVNASTLPSVSDVDFPHRQILLPSFSWKSPGLQPPSISQFSFVLQAQNATPGESPGEDVVLSNVLAFDVQAYDPYARVWPDNGNSPTVALVPSDPGYSAAAEAGNAATLLGLGAYVDLNYHRYLTTNAQSKDILLAAPAGANLPLPYFAFPFAPDPTAALNIIPAIPVASVSTFPTGSLYRVMYLNTIGTTYDTWSLSYERDGIDQFGDRLNATDSIRFDKQTNGLDDEVPNPAIWSASVGPFNGVDDVGERETVPPYSQPLRGLQVKIRVYEPSTRQVRQATVATDFITE